MKTHLLGVCRRESLQTERGLHTQTHLNNGGSCVGELRVGGEGSGGDQ